MKYLRRFFRRLFNALDWFWYFFKKDNDFDFDYIYLLAVIQKKLQKMEPVIRNGYSMSADKTADDIKETIKTLQLLIDDDFLKNFSALDGKYGEYCFTSNKLERAGITPENLEQYRLDFKEASRLDALEKKKVQNKLFRLLRKYENWWD